MLSNLAETLHSSAKLKKSKQPKFEVSNSKNKDLVTQNRTFGKYSFHYKDGATIFGAVTQRCFLSQQRPLQWVQAPLRSIGVPLLDDSDCQLPFYFLSLVLLYFAEKHIFPQFLRKFNNRFCAILRFTICIYVVDSLATVAAK